MQLHIKIIYGVLALLLVCTIIFLCYFIPQNLSAEVAACKPVLETANNTSETSKNDIFLEENMEEQESVIAESQHQINSFDIIFQMPELPTGCEITALTMVLNYYGMEADKVEMATKYLPTQELNLYYGSDGRLYGNDLNQYFIGNPTTENGYVCGTGAIVTAANAYLQDQGSDLTAVDYTGADVDTLYEIVLSEIQKCAKAALADEEAIERELQMSSKGGAVSEREVIERSISNDNERIRELERVIGRLYEDMVSGKLNEDTFNSILEQKQAEQATLKNRVRLNSERLAEREQEEIDSVRWIETIKEYADIRELDATTLNRLIRVIVIHEDFDGETVRQTVEIHWNFKGTSENA